MRAAHTCVALSLLTLFWACRPGSKVPTEEPKIALKRGDRVLVEPRAAEFREARVLAVEQSRVRLEVVANRETLSMAATDLYRLPPSSAKPEANGFAVCKLDERWLGCRVLRIGAGSASVITLEGNNRELPTTALLLPSALTELNLRQAFLRTEARLRFLREAERAGAPSPPAGFRVQARMRVVARRSGAWYSAVVQEVDDDVLYLTFATSAARERLPRSDVIPEPPWPQQPARGDYVLVRPLGPAEPWPTLRVSGVTDREFRVVGAVGDERSVTHRDLIPLGTR